MTAIYKLVAKIADLLSLIIKKQNTNSSIESKPDPNPVRETLHQVIWRYLIDYGTTEDKNFVLVGIRNSKGREKDVINDWLGFITLDGLFISKGTTEAGTRFTTDKTVRNPEGTFYLDFGFHKKIWCFGIHKGYEALVNDPKKCLPTAGWRDSNYNFVFDRDDIKVRGHFGINFHRMHPFQIVDRIGGYSSGCQVVNDNKDFQYIYQKAKESGLEIFDYVLIDIIYLPSYLREELCLS